MQSTTLNHDKQSWVRNTDFLIFEFASAFKLSVTEAFKYLKQYGGLDFLYRHLWALHTENPLYAARELFAVCRNNGGNLP
jgi:hypothetical protein